MSVAGKVCTGFSLPYVAIYSASGSTVSYSNGQKLARGVDVEISPNTSDNNIFYADNIAAESAGGMFTDGTFAVNVDGLHTAAEKLIMGLPTADEAGWMEYGDDQVVPYCGFGYVARYMSDGVTTYVPTILAKVIFDQVKSSAETQGESIDFKTQELTGKILRGDDANHNWKYVGKDYTTEALAEAALKAKLGIS